MFGKVFIICGVFLILGGLLLLYGICLFAFLNKLILETNWYKNQFIDSKKFLKDIPRNLEICNLGSNYSKFAFIYEDTILKGENWAVGPQSLSYDFRILKNYFTHLKDGGIVIITICPFSCCLIDSKNDETNANAKYYPFLNPNLIVGYSARKKKKYLYYPLLSCPKAIKYILYDIKADNRMSININPMTSEEIEKDAQHWIDGWKRQFEINNLDETLLTERNQRVFDYNTKLLSKMINFCIKKNLKPIIVIPPVTKALGSKMSKTFRELYIYSFIRKSNTQKIPVLDYLGNERLMDTNMYFNSFFMNSQGRRIFTDIVLKDICSIKSENMEK